MLFRTVFLFILLAVQGALATAQDRGTIDYEHSILGFEVRTGSTVVAGTFPNWRAVIELASQNGDDATVTVSIDIGSARTGNALIDSVLLTSDWLDSDGYAQARFQSTAVVPADDGSFAITGDLTLKGVTAPLTFAVHPFGPPPSSLLSGEVYRIEGALDRKVWDIGTDYPSNVAAEAVRITGLITLRP